MVREKQFAYNLIDFIDNSPSQFHATNEVKKSLDNNGFKELTFSDKWNLEKSGKYYVIKNGSAIVAFVIGNGNIEEDGFKLVGAHTDSPTFRIKPNPEIISEKSYLKLNTEVYGGPILSTWFDRPLSIAGRVAIKTDNTLKPKEVLVDLKKPIVIIPSLAIHMNRKVNEGVNINPQTDTLPILTVIGEEFKKDKYLINIVAENIGIDADDIMELDLFLYNTEKGSLIGANEEFISIGKLDNLAMVHAGLNGIIDSKVGKATNVLACFDNEEVGSRTKQGAASPMLRTILERIAISLGKNKEDFYRSLSNSFIISADQAHALHPNYPDKNDPTNKPIINKGTAIKISANQAYTSDSMSIAVYESICKSENIKVQKFVNRSDEKGGSTIGPISSAQLDISSVDIGNPILGMHSIKELGGVKDHYGVYKSFKKFYEI
ncbi:MAG: M18 family aminopeptidase [Tissierellia bacterium]|nr:M18 family aminopeptidase [Tissierellia bacterium]